MTIRDALLVWLHYTDREIIFRGFILGDRKKQKTNARILSPRMPISVTHFGAPDINTEWVYVPTGTTIRWAWTTLSLAKT